jgi:hypothetical protein
VSMRQASGDMVAEVHLRRVTNVPFPVTVRLKLSDGSTRDVKLPVEIWTHADRYTALVPVVRPVVGARLWPDPHVPDWNPSNDVWGDAPVVDRSMPATAGGLMAPILASPTRPRL